MFLDVTPFSEKEFAEYQRKYSNWNKIADTIYKTRQPQLVLQVLQLELMTRNRDYIIKRLYGRFLALRAAQDQVLYLFAKDASLLKETNQQLKNIMASWKSILQYFKIKQPDEECIKSFIRYELMHEKRKYILQRLYGKFNEMRREREIKEMQTWSLKNIQKKKLSNT
jgi:hypothetical protein